MASGPRRTPRAPSTWPRTSTRRPGSTVSAAILGLGALAGARLKEAKKHAEEIAALHLRTIEVTGSGHRRQGCDNHMTTSERLPLLAMTVARAIGAERKRK